jgi:predicted peroxiredoxin
MKKIGCLLFIALLFTACNPKTKSGSVSTQNEPTVAETVAPRDGVFIHITQGYDDPHRVLMPLKMATLMANDKDVLVYMDIHAVELLVKDAKDLTYADFESFQTYVKQLVDKGIPVMACPTCLKIAGYTPDDLMEGVQVAQKDKFFNFTKGRIVTLDY